MYIYIFGHLDTVKGREKWKEILRALGSYNGHSGRLDGYVGTILMKAIQLKSTASIVR